MTERWRRFRIRKFCSRRSQLRKRCSHRESKAPKPTWEKCCNSKPGRRLFPPNVGDDIHEILNYRAAMRQAEEQLVDLPHCQRVIRDAHAVLMRGVGGENKTPGSYRQGPNWIGPLGCTIDTGAIRTD